MPSRGSDRSIGSNDVGVQSSPGPQPMSAPAISLPKGGGAIRGIGEKFGTNPVTGTGSLTIPIASTPGRSGFAPQLNLSYDSGAGNGPFGLGWSLGLPSITRKTDKGLPRYRDSEESDDFILSGSEDLVPVLVKSGDTWGRESLPDRQINNKTYRIQRYRPRIEGLFARIERWTNRIDPTDVFWRSISKDNITTWYGKTENTRITDPNDDAHIFSWLICETYDDKGNVIVYEYKPEDSTDVKLSLAHERNRAAQTRAANRYVKSIKYGNRTPHFPVLQAVNPPTPLPTEWLFQVVFDYGEHHADVPLPGDAGSWPNRNDPFSSYRAGFEIRTYRLCQRVLMFHHFPAEVGVGANCLVRSTDFTYSFEADPTSTQNPVFSFLDSVTQAGYKRDGAGYLKKSRPPVEFKYTQPIVQQEVEVVDSDSLENLPYGLDGTNYRWVDLDGEGLSGILTEQGGGWFYKRNLSPINTYEEDGQTRVKAQFGPLEEVQLKPSLAAISSGRQQLLDLAGDGQLDLVQLTGPTPGFFERTQDENWENFQVFEAAPNLDWSDPNLKFMDLTGDGHADVMISEHQAFTWYPSLGETGFGASEKLRQTFDEEKGPRLVFADGTDSIYLSDMSGDGLNDLVRIRNGEVCYWPSLGFGRFGAKITMDNAPVFDSPDQFQQQRIRLADIDGSGLADIIYLKRDGVHIYFNQSGNSWSLSQKLAAFPQVDDLSNVEALDLLGNGTACLVWSSVLPGDVRQSMRYVDLMGGQKPHLMRRSVNNLGAETVINYVPSTKFYVTDKLAGKPWITRIPFPVHVVESVETYDHISKMRFVSRYAYHHGFFDGDEREFRGFGMVEQWDTEMFAALTESGELPVGDNSDAASHVPPTHTKTWFHTGVYLGRDHVSDFFAGMVGEHDAGEYYREPAWRDDDVEARKHLLRDTVLPVGITADEERAACRALKGAMLRREVYALDDKDKSEHPYIVTEQNLSIQILQRRGDNRHAVFSTQPRESVSYHYERNPTDPRIDHTLTLKVDEYGNILRSIVVSYPRADVPGREPEQNESHLTLTLNRFANRDDQPDWRHVGLPVETRTYEVVKPPAVSLRFTWEELSDLVEALVPPEQVEPTVVKTISYEQWDWRKQWNQETEPGGQANTRLRLIEHVRTLYRPDDMGAAQNDSLALLLPGMVESLALHGESYKLALTPGLLAKVYQRPLDVVQRPGGPPPENLLPNSAEVLGGDDCGYVDLDNNGHWWIPSGRIFFSPAALDTPVQELTYARQHFFLPHRYRDPFHTKAVSTESIVSFDSYNLLMLETRDALGNRVTVGERDDADNLTEQGNDYRVLQPCLLMDANRNRTAIVFDTLGMVVGTAVMGKPLPTPAEGDALDGFEADLSEAVILEHLANPLTDPRSILRRATTRLVYDLFAYQRTKDQPDPQPPAVYTLARETHDSHPVPASGLKIQHSFSYSDGFGREIQKKVQAEPGPVPKRDAEGKIIVSIDSQPEMTTDDVSPRWVGSGWTVFNNKGKPVREYEPFFTDTHRFEFDVRIGVSPVLFYDPIGRVVATLYPNHTWEKVVFDPWRQESWDVSDTLLVADPITDPDVGDFFKRLPEMDYLPTWHARREGGALSPQEQAAARQAAIHAETPAIAHADSLGRTFLTVAHNKFKYSDMPPAAPALEEFYRTRNIFDIEGNQREVLDANGRVVMRYNYDLLGNRIHQASMEAGERWTVSDVKGNPVYTWDSRNHQFRIAYDPLRRPTDSFLREGAGAELLVGRTVYGETQLGPEANNLRTRMVQLFDQAGVVTTDDYDFKGNLLRSQRQLAQQYKSTLDWSAAVTLEADTYISHTSYDALNRPTQLIAPDNTRIRPGYNEANLLERIEANLRSAQQDGQPVWTLFVTDIDYDAKGQRTLIDYGNNVRTTYTYDPLTFRLVRLLTRRDALAFPDDCPQPPPVGWPGCEVQNLHYTYDPVGNITHIRDDAQQTVYFRNKRVEPSADYTYDAINRLIEATGREHLGQIGNQPNPPTAPDAFNSFHTRLNHPGDGNAMGTYVERYVYDAVGNILSMQHRGNDPAHPGWTRGYAYNETSQLEAAKVNNRLSSTSLVAAAETYGYDGSAGLHGNITRMPHLPLMRWDYRDQLQATSRQVVGDGTPEMTWYVYDAAGQRVRKVTERQADAGQTPTRLKERIYLGRFEIYREYENGGDTITLERETLHIMDDQRRIALVETRVQGDDPSPTQLIRYQFNNHLGSASLELDDRAQLISYEEYYPYGSTSYQAARSQTETPKRYRYTGKERDEETGFQLHGLRYYCPWLGRWTKADPMGLVDGVNRYAYARGNPVRNVDTEGTQSTLSGIRGGLSRADEPEAITQPAPVRNVEDAAPQLGICRTDGRYTGARPAPIKNVEDTAPKLKPLDPRNAGTTPQEKFDKTMSEIGGLRRPVGNTGLAPAAAAALAPGAAARAEVVAASALGTRLTEAIKAIGVVANTATTVESHDDPDAGPAIVGGVMSLGGSSLLPGSKTGGETGPNRVPASTARETIEVPAGAPKPYEAPNVSKIDPIRPGESTLSYGTRAHQELPRIMSETNPSAQGRFNVAPGLTGEDMVPSSGLNANFAEMKSIRERQDRILRQAEKWGHDPQTGRFFFYDADTGLVFEGIIQTEKFPSGRFR